MGRKFLIWTRWFIFYEHYSSFFSVFIRPFPFVICFFCIMEKRIRHIIMPHITDISSCLLFILWSFRIKYKHTRNFFTVQHRFGSSVHRATVPRSLKSCYFKNFAPKAPLAQTCNVTILFHFVSLWSFKVQNNPIHKNIHKFLLCQDTKLATIITIKNKHTPTLSSELP